MSDQPSLADHFEALTKGFDPLPWCVDYTSAQIRHVARNCQIDCPMHDPEDNDCYSFGRYDGEAIAFMVNNRDRILEALRIAEVVKEHAIADPTEAGK